MGRLVDASDAGVAVSMGVESLFGLGVVVLVVDHHLVAAEQ